MQRYRAVDVVQRASHCRSVADAVIFDGRHCGLQVAEDFFQLHFVVYEHFARLGAVIGSHDSGCFKLVDNASCAIVPEL